MDLFTANPLGLIQEVGGVQGKHLFSGCQKQSTLQSDGEPKLYASVLQKSQNWAKLCSSVQHVQRPLIFQAVIWPSHTGPNPGKLTLRCGRSAEVHPESLSARLSIKEPIRCLWGIKNNNSSSSVDAGFLKLDNTSSLWATEKAFLLSPVP